MVKRIVMIMQARCGSTRLPKKVLRPLLGKSMLRQEIDRLKGAHTIDTLVVATSRAAQDDAIEVIATDAGVTCYRGSELDVLDRFYHAAREARADIVVRVTGDCPLHDPTVVDLVVNHFLSATNTLDYTSTPTNYPEGFDTEVFTFDALERAWKSGVLPSEREHVTPYIYTHPELFVCEKWTDGVEDNSKLHLSVDTEKDFTFVSAVYEHLYAEGSVFDMKDILKLLSHTPAIKQLHSGATGYEGYEKSLKEDIDYKLHHA